MNAYDPFNVIFRSASRAVIETVRRRRVRILRTGAHPVTYRKALPLDFSEPKPFEASLARNISAVLAEPVS